MEDIGSRAAQQGGKSTYELVVLSTWTGYMAARSKLTVTFLLDRGRWQDNENTRVEQVGNRLETMEMRVKHAT